MMVFFWDFDGTLVKSNSLWSKSVYRALKSTADSSVTIEEIKACMITVFVHNGFYENADYCIDSLSELFHLGILDSD